MSQILYVLVMVQGTSGLAFTPGFTTAAECMQQYKGPHVACFPYDPTLDTWTGFFRLEDGSLRTVGRINSQAECERYIHAFRSDIPAACRQLAIPVTCNVACRPAEPPPPPAAKPEPPPSETKPDPAAKNDDIQLSGGRYHYSKPLFLWIEDNDSTKVSDRDRPFIEPRAVTQSAPPEKPRRVARRARKPQQFDPFSALVSLFTPRGDW